MLTADPTECRKKRFEALLSPVLDAAYGTALRMTHNREDAADLIQEVALQAFRAFDTFQEGTNFKAWFFRILVNAFRYNYRKRKRGPTITCLEDASELYLYMRATEAGMVTRRDNPAEVVLGQMTEAQVANALAALPEEFRIVSTLYFMEEMSYQEIAEIVNCPVGTVRSRLHRGRKLLQKALWDMVEESSQPAFAK
jgi:RNA polymerase sigma-70 factor (ECF subfamily)